MAPDEIKRLEVRIDTGFANLFDKIDSMHREHILHKEFCSKHFAQIDQTLAVDEAVSKERCKAAKEKEKNILQSIEWGKWAVRLSLSLLAANAVRQWWVA